MKKSLAVFVLFLSVLVGGLIVHSPADADLEPAVRVDDAGARSWWSTETDPVTGRSFRCLTVVGTGAAAPSLDLMCYEPDVDTGGTETGGTL